MADRTELTMHGVVTITDTAEPVVTVLVPSKDGMPPASAWDWIPEWAGKVHQLDVAEIIDHPTVQRLMATGPPATEIVRRGY